MSKASYFKICVVSFIVYISVMTESKVTGEDIYKKTLEETEIYKDEALQEYVRNLG